MATGTPDVDDVIEAMHANASLASDVREGKLITVEVSPGNFRLGPRE
jgi:hypothetical protein